MWSSVVSVEKQLKTFKSWNTEKSGRGDCDHEMIKSDIDFAVLKVNVSKHETSELHCLA